MADMTTNNIFFGRSDHLALLNKRLQGFLDGYRQNIAVLGREAIGKTTLIQNFFHTSASEHALCVYFELRDEPLEHMIQRFLYTLLISAAPSSVMTSPGDMSISFLTIHLKTTCPRLAAAVASVTGQINNGKHDEAFGTLLDMINLLREETQRPVLVCLDEFHLLDELKLRNPFTALGNKIMIQRDIMYIIASSRSASAKRILTEKLTLLFGNFETVTVNEFSQYISNDFLDQHFTNVAMPAALRKFIIFYSDGSPFYLDVLSRAIRTNCAVNNTSEVSVQQVIDTFETEIFRSTGIIFQHCYKCLYQVTAGKTWNTALAILMLIAEESYSVKQLAQRLNKQTSEISKQIGRLVETGIISRCGSFYCFEDRLFRSWLKQVYRRHETLYGYNTDIPAQQFRREIEQAIHTYIHDTQHNVPQRIADLFRSFSNELVEIDGKRRRLPNFSDVEIKKLDTTVSMITARDEKRKWLCLINLEPVFEATLMKSINATKSLKERSHQKVFITMNGIDMNAKLFAKEERMWLWGLKDLNLLLELYKKPLIVE